MSPVHFRRGRPSRWFFAALAVTAAVGVVFLASPDWDLRLFGIAWLGLIGWLGAVLLRRPVGETVITIDDVGVFDRRIMQAPIRWDEISRVEAFEAEGSTWVGIELINPRASLAKTGWLTRVMAPIQRLMWMPSLSLNMAFLDGTPEDVIRAVEAARPDLVAKEKP